MSKHVFISLLNWNSWQDCVNCVHSLEKLNTSDVQITIRILDNASPNNSLVSLKEALPDYDIIGLDVNQGYAAGHLENLKYAKSIGVDFFWILNSDVELTPETLQAFIKAYEHHGDHLFGSVTLNEDKTIDFAGSSESKEHKLNYNDWKGDSYQKYIEKFPDVQEVQSVEGSSMFIPLSVIDKYGFMKTDFFMYGEESDYCLRLKKHGAGSYVVSEAVIYHKNAGSMTGCEALEAIPAYYRRRNFLRLSMDHFGMKKLDALRYHGSIVNSLKSVIKGKLSTEKSTSYYYALANLHAWMGRRGKVVNPEKLYEQCLSSRS